MKPRELCIHEHLTYHRAHVTGKDSHFSKWFWDDQKRIWKKVKLESYFTIFHEINSLLDYR